MNAKEILYSNGELTETQDTKRLYNKTHGHTEPGEQRNRNYDWNIDKDNHVFGRPQVREFDGAKNTLMSDRQEGNFPKTVLVNKRSEDYRQATNDMLGKGKFRGTMNEQVVNNEGFAFGIRTINDGNDVWNVGKLIHGNVNSQREVDPDIDLGKSTTYKSKLKTQVPHTPDPRRSFGVPSIRNDIPKKTKESFTNKMVH
jgi:hypothetical protein